LEVFSQQQIGATELYSRGEAERGRYLRVAKTLCELMVDIFDTDESIEVSNQSLGADLLSSLSSKLIKSIFPFGSSFYRLYMSDIEDGNQEDANNLLISLEEEILKKVSDIGIRAKLTTVLDNLLLSGNILLDTTGDALNYYRLDEYVVFRRESGEWYRVVIKKKIVVLPDDSTIYTKYIKGLDSIDNEYDFYIVIDRNDKEISTIKEYIMDMHIIERDRKDIENVGIYPIRLTEETGRNYCYGYAYRYLGDLIQFDKLSRISLVSSSVGSKVIHLVNPTSHLANNLDELNQARSGDYIIGIEGDVMPYTSPHMYNLEWILGHLGTIEKRLSIAFLRGVGAVRDSERTTAYEVQMLISEMSEKFGGFYITISNGLQKPIFEFLVRLLKIDSKVGKNKQIEVEFLNGVSALRNQEQIQKLQQLVPLEVIAQEMPRFISTEKVFKVYAKNLGLIATDLIKDKEEIANEESEATQKAMMAQQLQQGQQQ